MANSSRYPKFFGNRLAYYFDQIKTILDGRIGTMIAANGTTALALRNADDWVDAKQAPKVVGLEVILEPAYNLTYQDFASGGLVQHPRSRVVLKQWDVSKTTLIEADLLLSKFALLDRRSVVRVPRHLKPGIVEQTTLVIDDYLEVFY